MRMGSATFVSVAGVVGVLSAVAACGSVDPAAEGSADESTDVGQQEEAIINGTPTTGFTDQRTVYVQIADVGSCTGTLLRADVVMTAKHCVHSAGQADQTSGFVSPSAVTVKSQDLLTTVNVSALEVMTSPNLEGALLHLTTPLRPLKHFVPLTGRPASFFQAKSLACPGFGINAATQSECMNGGGNGGGVLRIMSSIPAAFPANRISFFNNGANQVFDHGDSGTTCFYSNPNTSVSEALGPLGWFSTSSSCVNFSGQWAPAGADVVDPNSMRTWVRTIVNGWEPDTNEQFNTNVISAFSVVEPTTPSQGPSNWSWQINSVGGFINQTSNIFQDFGNVTDGTKLILQQRPLTDGTLQAHIISSDDDDAGLVARYQDQTHFYQLTVGEGGHNMIFAKRRGPSYLNVQTVNLPGAFTWSAGHYVGLIAFGCQFGGTLDGNLIGLFSDPDCDYMDGLVGFISAGMGGGGRWINFDNLTIQEQM